MLLLRNMHDVVKPKEGEEQPILDPILRFLDTVNKKLWIVIEGDLPSRTFSIFVPRVSPSPAFTRAAPACVKTMRLTVLAFFAAERTFSIDCTNGQYTSLSGW